MVHDVEGQSFDLLRSLFSDSVSDGCHLVIGLSMCVCSYVFVCDSFLSSETQLMMWFQCVVQTRVVELSIPQV